MLRRFDETVTKLCPLPCAIRQVRSPEYPERSIRTGSGVTSLDFSQIHPTLLAVGMYDGTIAIYDTARETEVSLPRQELRSYCTVRMPQCSWVQVSPWHAVDGVELLGKHFTGARTS